MTQLVVPSVPASVRNFTMQAKGLVAPGVVGLYGESGSTKSSIAATWPKPMVVFDFEHGWHRIWGLSQVNGQWLYNGEPGLVDVRFPAVPAKSLTTRYEVLEGWRKAWGEFTSQFVAALEDKSIKTIVWDTATVEWGLCCDCFLEELQHMELKPGSRQRKQLQQIEYGEPNRRQRELLNTAVSYGKWLILTHHETDKYAPVMGPDGKPVLDEENRPRSAPTGEKVPDGFRYTINACDWLFYTKKQVVVSSQNGVKAKTITPVTEIEKSALGIDLVGVSMEWFTYPFFEQNVLPMYGRVKL